MDNGESAKPVQESPRGWRAVLERLTRPALETVSLDPVDEKPDEPTEVVVTHELPPGEVARAGLVLLGLGLGAYLLHMIQEVLLCSPSVPPWEK